MTPEIASARVAAAVAVAILAGLTTAELARQPLSHTGTQPAMRCELRASGAVCRAR